MTRASVLFVIVALASCTPTRPVDEPPPQEVIRTLSPPVAVIASSATKPSPLEQVTFDGSQSYDPERASLEFAWAVRSAPAGSDARLSAATGAVVTLTPELDGIYVVELTVTAQGRVSGAAVAILTVTTAESSELVASAGVDRSASVGDWVVLDGSASRAPPGATARFQWSFLQQPPGSTTVLYDADTATPRFLADLEGDFSLQLEVSAGAERMTDSVEVAVGPANHPPIAVAGAGQRVMGGQEVELDGSGSSDPDGDPITYAWSVVSQPSGGTTVLSDASSPKPRFTPAIDGFYSFELTVTDARGLSSKEFARVIVSPNASQTGLFDPEEIYIAGTLSEGACYRDAMAHWAQPDSAAVGFDCYFDNSNAVIRPTDGRLLYTNTFEDQLREFHCDGCPYSGSYPNQVLANDPVVPTPCPVTGEKMRRFKVSPQGLVFHTCAQSQNHWRDHTGAMVYDATPAPLQAVGYNGWLLTQSQVLNVGTMTSWMVTGLPSRTWVTSRAKDSTTFWVVLAGATSTDAPELWTVSTLGTAQLVGAYPAIPTGFTAYASGRLDSAGALFSEGRDVSGSFVDVIVRRTVGATSDVIYTEADNPLVKLHISALVTGP